MKLFFELYAAIKWELFPVNGKIPAIKGWQEKATSKVDELNELFKAKHTGIGLATGKRSDITTVDVDNKNGVNGFHTLKVMGIEMPVTLCVETPSGGRQYHFKYCPDLKNMVAALGEGSGIDIRNDGGLVILPPSIHPNGKPYEWHSDHGPAEIELAVFPEDLLKAIKERTKTPEKGFELTEKILLGQRNDTLFKYASKLRSSGLEKFEILSAVAVVNKDRCEKPLEEDEINTLVESACNYDKGFIQMDSKGRIRKTMLNVVGLFKTDQHLISLFYHNLFTGSILYSRSPIWLKEIKPEKRLDDTDLILIKHYLSSTHKLEVHVAIIQEAVVIIAYQNGRHPVRKYLSSLRWDGQERLNKWLTVAAGVVDTPYTSCVGAKTLIAAVARVFLPGIKYDTMLILEGDQGLGKSTLVKTLAGDWFTTVTITDKDKDTVDIMIGAWIIEVEEMVCFRREDIEHIKAFLSRSVDKMRLAYRRNSEDFPRQSVFIGTINPSGDRDYLRDSTGNRRFWPVLCKKQIDLKWLKENRDQLFAEAVIRFNNDENLWIDDSIVLELVKEEQEIRQQKDIWAAPIHEYINLRNCAISANEILEKCLHILIEKASKSDQTRVGIVMSSFGWKRYYDKASKCSMYYPKDLDPDNTP